MSINTVRATELKIFEERTTIANQIFGSGSFAIAAIALGSNDPQAFAFVGLLCVLAAAWMKLQRFNKLWAVFREMKHDLQRIPVIWKELWLAWTGWLFLGLIALGVVTKNGLQIPEWVIVAFKAAF